MEGKTFQFNFNELNISVSQVENVIGFNEDDDREFVRNQIDEILDECRTFANIKAEYRVYNDIIFDNTAKSVAVDDVTFDIKKIIFAQIKKSDSAILFLCTAGEEIGKRSRQAMQERDLLRGYIYDVAGSEIVEAAADLMQEEMKRSAESDGKKITNRYSPGYCGWDVAEQHKLFKLFRDNYCGIRLTPSALMDPEKSVSGIIGLGENVKLNPYTCRLCEMKNCLYRKFQEAKIVS